MWTRISYFSRETLVSLRRNVLMTIAGIPIGRLAQSPPELAEWWPVL